MSLELDTLLQFLGRLHPLSVHFPIALLVVAGVIELAHLRSQQPTPAGVVCLAFGALGAVFAAWFGWLYAEHEAVADSTDLFRHRWTGISIAALSVFALVAGHLVQASRGGSSRHRCLLGYRVGLFLSVGLVAYGAHLGGRMVYGEGYLLDVLRGGEQERTPDPGGATEPGPDASTPEASQTELAVTDPGASGAPVDGSETPDEVFDPGAPTVDFATQILPILEESCFDCHGPSGRAKGGLRLHDPAILTEGPEEYWLVRPGDSAASLLVELISLPAGHEELMPKDGDPLGASQIALIAQWVDEGARGEAAPPEAAASDPETSEPAAGTEAPVAEPAQEPGTPGSFEENVAAIRAFGAHATRVALDVDEVAVNLGLAGARADDASLDLLAGLEEALVELDLSRSAVTDAGVERLASFARLQRLRLDHTAVGDAALATLGTLGELEVLNLVGTAVTDEGLGRLAPLSALRRLYLWKTDVTAAGARALSEALPELRIELGDDPSGQ
jgi:uncharacterized membrane protein/mono/diheme cytochrome c family protein